MKKMKRIEAIIKGRKFTEKLFGLKKKQIRRAIEAATDNAEKQKEDALIAYEGLFARMAEDDADYESIINQMLEQKQLVRSADTTIEVLAEISDDLDAEVEVDDENEK